MYCSLGSALERLGRWLAPLKCLHTSMGNWVQIPITHLHKKPGVAEHTRNPITGVGGQKPEDLQSLLVCGFSESLGLKKLSSKEWKKAFKVNLWPPHVNTHMLHTHINMVIFRCTLHKTVGPVTWHCTNFNSELGYFLTVTHFFRSSSSEVLWAPQLCTWVNSPCLHFLMVYFSPGLRLEFFHIRRRNLHHC